MNKEAIQGRILVVDDNRMNRIKLARYLEQQGLTVVMAENGREALQKLGEQPFDVVLLDIIMPEMDGFAVLAEIQKDNHLRDIPVIVISALDEMDSVVRCIEMGALDYLPKSVDPVLLQARLNTSLQRKKLRDLERSYLQQELMLRQSEKLATLGKLSAGMAHELNNPAAAAQRGAEQLAQAVTQMEQAHLALHLTPLTESQRTLLVDMGQRARQLAERPLTQDGMARSGREEAMELWLDEYNVGDGWLLAPTLVSLELSPAELKQLANLFPAGQLAPLLTWLHNLFTVYSLLAEIREGSGRISAIVKSLKSYVYLDQAPIQLVDVHEGLNNTLLMLRSRLRQGITVQQQYQSNLPRIEAYGSELNQVWTNIIDNAISAMKGQGELRLSTAQEGNWVVVEICDNGPGIPAGIQNKIFDPFFTTKAPGEGTGLGLNISHNIIVQKHHGQIAVASRPGQTCFTVRLPIQTNN